MKWRTGIDYTINEAKETLNNAYKILKKGGKIDGESILGEQIMNSINKVLSRM